jgi:hypothetical protein
MGSLGRLIGTSLGRTVFLRIMFKKIALEPPRGRPFGGGGVYRVGGMGGSAPTFVIISNTCVTY